MGHILQFILYFTSDFLNEPSANSGPYRPVMGHFGPALRDEIFAYGSKGEYVGY